MERNAQNAVGGMSLCLCVYECRLSTAVIMMAWQVTLPPSAVHESRNKLVYMPVWHHHLDKRRKLPSFHGRCRCHLVHGVAKLRHRQSSHTSAEGETKFYTAFYSARLLGSNSMYDRYVSTALLPAEDTIVSRVKSLHWIAIGAFVRNNVRSL